MKLYFELLNPYGNFTSAERNGFEEEVNCYCKNNKSMYITSYFMDMVNICLKHEIVPPKFLFCMAKTFVCLNGMTNISQNTIKASELLKEQILEFYIKNSLQKGINLSKKSFETVPKLLESTLEYGLISGLAKELTTMEDVYDDLKQVANNYTDVLKILEA